MWVHSAVHAAASVPGSDDPVPLKFLRLALSGPSGVCTSTQWSFTRCRGYRIDMQSMGKHDLGHAAEHRKPITMDLNQRAWRRPLWLLSNVFVWPNSLGACMLYSPLRSMKDQLEGATATYGIAAHCMDIYTLRGRLYQVPPLGALCDAHNIAVALEHRLVPIVVSQSLSCCHVLTARIGDVGDAHRLQPLSCFASLCVRPVRIRSPAPPSAIW